MASYSVSADEIGTFGEAVSRAVGWRKVCSGQGNNAVTLMVTVVGVSEPVSDANEKDG